MLTSRDGGLAAGKFVSAQLEQTANSQQRPKIVIGFMIL
jgi:hypothetical protein